MPSQGRQARRRRNEFYRLLTREEREQHELLLRDLHARLARDPGPELRAELQAAQRNVERELAADAEGFEAWSKARKRSGAGKGNGRGKRRDDE